MRATARKFLAVLSWRAPMARQSLRRQKAGSMRWRARQAVASKGRARRLGIGEITSHCAPFSQNPSTMLRSSRSQPKSATPQPTQWGRNPGSSGRAIRVRRAVSPANGCAPIPMVAASGAEGRAVAQGDITSPTWGQTGKFKHLSAELRRICRSKTALGTPQNLAPRVCAEPVNADDPGQCGPRETGQVVRCPAVARKVPGGGNHCASPVQTSRW